MASIVVPEQDQANWKQLFASSLRKMNCDTDVSHRRITLSQPDQAKETTIAIAEAANCLAALWNISKPKRHDGPPKPISAQKSGCGDATRRRIAYKVRDVRERAS